MELMDRRLKPIVSYMMTRPLDTPYCEAFWLRKWLIIEINNIAVPLQEDVCQAISKLYEQSLQFTNADSVEVYYMLRTIAEVLAARCHVLEGQWEQVAENLIYLFDVFYDPLPTCYGPTSERLTVWIIRIVGDPDLCPNPDLHIKMLVMFRALVNIDVGNNEQALASLMSSLSLLDMHSKFYKVGAGKFYKLGAVKTKVIIDCLKLFTKDLYLNQFDLKVTDNLKKHRKTKLHIMYYDISHEYAMGVKILTEPGEVKSLIALLKYISHNNVIIQEYKSFQRELSFMFLGLDSNIKIILEESYALLFLIKNFKSALLEPELRDVLVESIMEMLEGVVLITWGIAKMNITQRPDIEHDDFSYLLLNVEMMLMELCDDSNDDDETRIVQEISKKYKWRICYIRSLIIPNILNDVTIIYKIIYND